MDQRSELAAVQAEVRQLGAHINDLVTQLGKVGRGNGAEPAPPKPAAAKVTARPAAGTRFASR